MKRSIVLAALMAYFALMVATPSLAKGTSDLIVVSGPGIKGEMRITSPNLLRSLSFGALEQEFRAPLSFEPHLEPEDGYRLRRYFRQANGSYSEFDTVRYYPGVAGGRGLVLYVGIYNSRSSSDNHWYYASPEGDAAMRRVIAAAPFAPARAAFEAYEAQASRTIPVQQPQAQSAALPQPAPVEPEKQPQTAPPAPVPLQPAAAHPAVDGVIAGIGAALIALLGVSAWMLRRPRQAPQHN